MTPTTIKTSSSQSSRHASRPPKRDSAPEPVGRSESIWCALSLELTGCQLLESSTRSSCRCVIFQKAPADTATPTSAASERPHETKVTLAESDLRSAVGSRRPTDDNDNRRRRRCLALFVVCGRFLGRRAGKSFYFPLKLCAHKWRQLIWCRRIHMSGT